MCDIIGDSGILGIPIYSKINKHNGWRRYIRMNIESRIECGMDYHKTGFMYVQMYYSKVWISKAT